MEESVALDSEKQKQFIKSVRGLKKLIKKKDESVEPKPKPSLEGKTKDGRIRKKRRDKGLVYLSHIPHGFYEHEMTQYFRQFGVVTNARVIRSKRTGNSKGYAFVEFKEPAVGQIVAETMNNYLMGKRLIKAAYIPPEKQRFYAFRKKWNSQNNPANDLRIRMKMAYNENKDDKGELRRAKKLLSNLSKTKKKLEELGINYDFFTPVDVPEILAKDVKVKQEDDSTENNADKIEHLKPKKAKRIRTQVVEDKTVLKVKKEKSKGHDRVVNIKVKKARTEQTALEDEVDKDNKLLGNKKHMEVKQNKLQKNLKDKDNMNTKSRNKQQQQKQDKLKEAGSKIVEEFIKTNHSDDSDSSADFDSDEFEKMMQDSDFVSSGDDEPENDSDAVDKTRNNNESSEEEVAPKRKKVKFAPAFPLFAKKQKSLVKQEKIPLRKKSKAKKTARKIRK